MKRLVLAVIVLILSIPSFSQDTTRILKDSIPRKGPPRKMPPKQPAEKSRTGSLILDDSTKNVYGPTTTMWMSERDYFTGQGRYRPLDTAIRDFHRWMRVQQLDNMYHDLGNNGTAMNSIFPEAGETGADPGYKAYSQYIKAYDLKVYDTKSPFTRMYFIWGSRGRAVTDAEYSRNITPKWNVSFSYRALLSDKLVLRQGKGDRQVIEHYYDIHSHYSTPKDFYKVRIKYQRIRHRVRENGGLIITSGDSTYNAYFDDQQVAPRLRVARNAEQINNVHLQHQLGPKQAHVYHQFDFRRQVNWFRDELDLETLPDEYFDFIRLDSPKRSLDSVVFTTFSNQVGIKGNFGRQNQFFYNGYARLRSYEMFNWNMRADTLALPMKANELYTGGELQYAFDSLQYVTALAETLDGGYGRMLIAARTRWLDVNARRMVSKPTFLQTGYAGTFDLWENTFRRVTTTQAAAFAKVTVGPLFVAAGGTYTNFKNYIYFAERDTFPGTSQRVLPLQTSQDVTYATPEIRMDLTIIKRIHIRPRLLYTRMLNDADSVLRIPKYFFNGQLAFEDNLFKGKLEVQIGVDVHWHSAYRAMGYDLVNQTFYNQDKVTTPAYLLADIFFTAKMKRGRFFFKYYNAGQLLSGVGFMPTPYYRGAQNLLDFGIDMLLFD